ncbi:hypothetical protein BLS_009737 [Venturia inaequalis]|uniref:alpha-galactosidase n=1 Tax=Venturia inaequalis TaxID=5025 RepID=A0A8H3U4J2_VENIN|nr:hypothetical protein BLS_009737 [Venturia inaequalis]
MTVSLLTRLILASAALSWAASTTNQLDASVATIEDINEPALDLSDIELLASIKNTQDTEEADIDEAESVRGKTWWQPTDTTFQIILSKVMLPNPDNSTRKPPQIEPTFASVFEVDLFDTPSSTMRAMKRAGRKVICYFSAGTSEDWRPDYKDFKPADKGKCLAEWAGERYLDVRSPNVWHIMRNRIRLAKRKGCDAIDPDNVDVANNDNGKNLTQSDAITFIKKIANEAHRQRMAFGLKNAQDTLVQVINMTDFAVNESCAQDGGAEGCASYANFTKLGRPVYHIEYTNYTTNPSTLELNLCSSLPLLSNLTSDGIRDHLCLRGYENTIGRGFSTVIKNLGLDEWVLYCDGRWSKSTVEGKLAVVKARFECPIATDTGLGLKSPQGEGLCKAPVGNNGTGGAGGGERRRVKTRRALGWLGGRL